MNVSLRRAGGILGAAIALSVAGLAASGVSPAPSGPVADKGAPLRARIDALRTKLLAHYREIATRWGLADVMDARLDGDEANLFIAGKPDNVSADDFWRWDETIVALDESLVDQLVSGRSHEIGAIRGIDDVPITPRAGGPSEPCAIFVPDTYTPQRPAPLVVLLHGKGTSEASELAEPVFRAAAIQSGAIIIAPFGSGDDLRAPGTAAKIYDALDAVEGALAIDHRRVFLAGDSLGGYAAFDVATVRPDAWFAILAIRSTMDASDQDAVRRQLRGKAVYVVAGSADNIVPVDDVRKSVAWFRSAALAATYYEVPGAGHDLAALAPFVSRAWGEMLAGVRSVQPIQLDIPMMTPAPSQKP